MSSRRQVKIENNNIIVTVFFNQKYKEISIAQEVNKIPIIEKKDEISQLCLQCGFKHEPIEENIYCHAETLF